MTFFKYMLAYFEKPAAIIYPNLSDDERLRMAESLLKNPLLTAILAEMKRQSFETWVSTIDADKEGRERLWLSHRLILKFENELKFILEKAAYEDKIKELQIAADAMTAAEAEPID